MAATRGTYLCGLRCSEGTRHRGRSGIVMPLLRYFVFVGGVLLALLLICDAIFPNIPLPSTLTSGTDRPAIRIWSERKWPERVVIDTSIPTPVHSQLAAAEPNAKAAAAPTPAREAFAQMMPTESKQRPTEAQRSAKPTSVHVADASSRSRAAGPKAQLRRKIARARPARPIVVAQQPHFGFGWFASTW